MPSITITVSARDWTRIQPAIRRAYGPSLDLQALVADDQLVPRALRYHIQQIVKDYERAQAENSLLIPDLDQA